MDKAKDAFDFLNEYAPEHLIIASDDAEKLAELVKNAGSVFLGNLSPKVPVIMLREPIIRCQPMEPPKHIAAFLWTVL